MIGVVLTLWGAPAHANDTVAIVEDISGPPVGVELLDYLAVGQRINLGNIGSIVIGYFDSCWREEITGGRVTIGQSRSAVEGGRVLRQLVECDGGRLVLSPEQQQNSGVLVYREPPRDAGNSLPAPQVTLYSLSPLIRTTGQVVEITIERLDEMAEPLTLPLSQRTVDLLEHGDRLTPGGLYRVVAGTADLIFTIDPLAESEGSLIGRILIVTGQ